MDDKTQEIITAEAMPQTQLTLPTQEKTYFQQMIEASKELDIEKIKQLQGIHERMQDREAEKLFNIDFIPMKAELPLVIKLHENEQTHSKYAKLEDINKQIDPILGKHGFGTAMKVMAQSADSVTVRVFLRHRDGHAEQTDVTMPIDDKGMAGAVNKTKPHGIASTIMYCRRVGECLLLNISTGNDNDGNQDGAFIQPDLADTIKEQLAGLEPEFTAKFLKFMGAKSVEEILAKDTRKALANIEARKKKIESEKAKGKSDV